MCNEVENGALPKNPLRRTMHDDVKLAVSLDGMVRCYDIVTDKMITYESIDDAYAAFVKIDGKWINKDLKP